MDIHAGHMIQLGPRNFLAYAHFAIPISITVEGANILTRNLIIFGQGAIRCHPYLLKEIELLTASETKLPELDKIFMSHIGFLVSNLLRCFAYGLSAGKCIVASTTQKKIRRYERQLTRMSTALSLIADVSLMLLGGSLKRRERISARLGDIMSQLYLASAVIKYCHDNQYPVHDIDYVCWSIQHCLYKIQIAFNELFHNFPNRWIGWCLQWIIFPFGSAYQAPNDYLYKSIIGNMLTPSTLRDRLTSHIYLNQQEDDLGFRLDKALTMIPVIEPLWKKIQHAIQQGNIPKHYDFESKIRYAQQSNIISQDEAITLTKFEKLKNEIIKVNEFTFKLDKIIA
jgi:acyl-CoA dehydrogenase